MGRKWLITGRIAMASVAISMLILAGSGEVWSNEVSAPTTAAAPAARAAAAVRADSPQVVPIARTAPRTALSFQARGGAPALQAARILPAQAVVAKKPLRYLLVAIESDMPVTSRPGGGRTIGVMPSSSKYYRFPTVAWVLERSPDGKYGRVTLPYSGSRRTGWIPLKGLERSRTSVMVRVDVSRHRLTLVKGGKVIMRTPAAMGAPWSPTPTGTFFVTDRVDPGSPYGYLGAFAFGISGIQTRLPPGWSGGNQLAIHGTNNPSSIGKSASAGCVRVSARALMRLKPLLRLGTPVIIRP
jgi:lipoprotein-anchoring transpeptidase ErfK/SrfK